MTAEFKDGEIAIPSAMPLEDWLANLAYNQETLKHTTRSEGGFSRDFHVFKTGSSRMVHTQDGVPMTSVLVNTSTGTSVFVDSNNVTTSIEV